LTYAYNGIVFSHKNEALIGAATQMSLENIMSNERR
jgi:hypothetical protein